MMQLTWHPGSAEHTDVTSRRSRVFVDDIVELHLPRPTDVRRRMERRTPEPCAQVRILPRAPSDFML